jgi:hypothetical protein
VSCPFFGKALIGGHERPVLFPSHGNQCAMITSSFSPCWMTTGEERPPRWEHCPRNPEWLATSGPEAKPRFAAHLENLRRNQAIANHLRPKHQAARFTRP